MSEVILIPGSHHWFALSERWEINILMVVHNIRTFMAINICSFRGLPPLETEPGHPLAGCIERNRFADAVTLYHLRFIHKIDDSLVLGSNDPNTIPGPAWIRCSLFLYFRSDSASVWT